MFPPEPGIARKVSRNASAEARHRLMRFPPKPGTLAKRVRTVLAAAKSAVRSSVAALDGRLETCTLIRFPDAVSLASIIAAVPYPMWEDCDAQWGFHVKVRRNS